MSFTSPRTWVAGEVVTAAIGNTHWRDNLRYLKGLDGAVTLSDALILPDGAGYYLHIPILTTTQRDALTPTAGMLIYNSTTTQFNKYENAAWRADLGFNSHHGDLSGLTDDDHTQYQKESLLTTRGDTIRRSATDWERLALGTSGQYLSSNGTDVVWAAGTHVANTIVIWAGTIANIPAGFVICDGNNSTPNLLTRFIEGVATAATDPGATGGATNKTTAGHTHSIVGSGAVDVVNGSASAVTSSSTDTIADIRPLYYDVAFIMKT